MVLAWYEVGAPTITRTHFSFRQMKFNSTCKNDVYPLTPTFLKKKIFFYDCHFEKFTFWQTFFISLWSLFICVQNFCEMLQTLTIHGLLILEENPKISSKRNWISTTFNPINTLFNIAKKTENTVI
jgi:hypothetical protein